MDANWNPAEQQQLEGELLELHFGCHPDPDALQARLLREPALRALQQRVLATANLLQQAAVPPQAPLRLPQPSPRTFWRSPRRRLLTAAAAAVALVAAFAASHGVRLWQLDRVEHEQCRVTLSAPRAVPAGAPWSFTVESQDLDGVPMHSELSWRALAADGSVLASGSGPTAGRSAVAITAGMAVPQHLEVTAQYAGGSTTQQLSFETTASPPLVHVTTDKPVYRPGEPVFIRTVTLDRCSLQPSPSAGMAVVTIKDAKGGLVFQQGGNAITPNGVETGVGSCIWQVPPESAGGEHTVEVSAWDGTFPTERQTFVVRAFAAPKLQKEITLDRKTYAPGAHGSAEVAVLRLGAGAAQGASVRGSLVLDGDEVWNQDGVLDARGKATFRFAVPATVRQGAARFVARITDGGVVETEVRPFVVPTGEVLATAYPEGGELIAGVENRLYVELLDPLGRPIDGVGVIETARGERVAEFATAHQGRARTAFVPEADVAYVLRTKGLQTPLSLPPVRDRGIALRGDGIAAGQPLRVHLAGRGDGPWLVGAFCRGVLLGQVTCAPDARGAIDEDVALDLPAQVAGVLRVTVFDRTLRPVAERLVQRDSAQRVQLAFAARNAVVAPGDSQQVTVRATDERGNAIAGAALGLMVSDGSAIAMGTEPRIGLLDQWLLFADCERMEDLGEVLVGSERQARNVDLLLGTRGWRRFVWKNDDGAKAAIAKAGDWGKDQLLREGFAQSPQVASNGEAAAAALIEPGARVRDSLESLRVAAAWALVVLLLALLVECAIAIARRRWLVQVAGYGALAVGALVGITLLLAPAYVTGMSAIDQVAALDGQVAGDVLKVAHFAPPTPPMHYAFGAGAGGEQWAALRAGVPEAQAWDALAAVDGVNLFEEARRGDRGEEAKKGDDGDEGLARFRDVAEFHRRDQVGYLGFAAVSREYAHKRTSGAERTDFTDTICWQPLLLTDARGEATATFDTSDAVTTWHVRVDAHGSGRIGQGEATFTARLPFRAEAKLPVEVSAGDRLLVPVALERTDGEAAPATLDVAVTGPLMLEGPAHREVALVQGRGRELLPIVVGADAGTATLAIAGRAGRYRDEIKQSLLVAPRGFPHVRSWGGKLAHGEPATVTVPLPADSVQGSGHLLLRVFPSPLAGMAQGLQGLLHEPCGCFEQASSSNYPNVMVLSYLQACGDDVPAIAARARELLPRGYQRITGYECKERGYEWFGGDPGHEALTAYGLLQFHDMQQVHDVDAGMVQRTTQWLLQRRDGKGGYQRNDRALDSFGRAPQQVTDAYVTMALVEAGTDPGLLKPEVAAVAARAATTDDAYELALCTGALGRARHDGAAAARQRLVALQQPDGSLRGSSTSITSSGGDDLTVETTAWAALAWLQDDAFAAPARRASEFLQARRSAQGTFGATQATICALRALTAYAQHNRAMKAPGTIAVFAGERRLAEQRFEAGQAAAVEFELWPKLPPGEHALRLELLSEPGVELPWAMDLGYHSELPADDPDGAVGIATRLLAGTVGEGATVALEVMLQNRSDKGQPMAIALVGLPAGLELPTRVLDDRKKAGDFDLWELKGRELALYWRSLAPKAERRVALDLVAAIPGTTTGPASRAYLYYTPQQKRWATPLRVEVTPAK